jgi:SAM-dependent methyltransferase
VIPDIPEFSDPRLVAIFETINAYDAGAQPGFYIGLAAELHARSIVDVGCGTGLITRELARLGYQVTGIDPAPAMVDVARTKPGGDRVHWICGEVTDIGKPAADLAMMSGHVAQFFVSDESWRTALAALHGALQPGGTLAFESRNPAAREWERWTRATAWSADDPEAGTIVTWTEVEGVGGGIVSYVNHYVFAATGEEVVSPCRLRFRTREELTGSLAEAGFEVETIYGDWDRRPPGPKERELIVVAKSRELHPA